MAVKLQPCLLYLPLPLCFFFFIPFSSCQSDSPLNIETFYPFPIPSPENPNNTQIFPPPPSPVTSLPPLAPPLAPVPPAKQDSTSNGTVARAVAATAASTLVVSAVLFFLIRMVRRRRETGSGGTQAVGSAAAAGGGEFRRFDGNVKGLIVDENGLDVLYWRRLELVDQGNSSFQKSVFHGPKHGGLEEEEEEEEREIINGGNQRIQEIPLFRGRSSSSYNKVAPEVDGITALPADIAVQKPPSCPTPPSPTPVLSKPMPPPPPTVSSKSMMSVPKSQSAAPPPPPVASKSVMSAPKNQGASQPPPPPPPVPAKKNQAPQPPPPPPRAISAKQTLVRKGMQSESKVGVGESSNREGGIAGSGNDHVKLKPLHWDKLKPNGDHSMVWDKIDNGSFR